MAARRRGLVKASLPGPEQVRLPESVSFVEWAAGLRGGLVEASGQEEVVARLWELGAGHEDRAELAPRESAAARSRERVAGHRGGLASARLRKVCQAVGVEVVHRNRICAAPV